MLNIYPGTVIECVGTLHERELADVTWGRHYVIDGKDMQGDIYFIDDAGVRNFAASENGLGIFEIVSLGVK